MNENYFQYLIVCRAGIETERGSVPLFVRLAEKRKVHYN